MTVNYLIMDNRIRMEKQHKPIDQVTELILDNCQATQISGLSEEFTNLETLSIINVGLTTLKGFPKLKNLKRLALCDNKLSDGLNNLLGCPKLQELNLSGNNFRDLSSLDPLRSLRDLTCLDIYNCDITRFSDYKQKVFDLLPSLQLLDSFDRDYNKEPEPNVVSETTFVEGANKEATAPISGSDSGLPGTINPPPPPTTTTTNPEQPDKEPDLNVTTITEEGSKDTETTCPMNEVAQVVVEVVADGDVDMTCDDAMKDNDDRVEVVVTCQPETVEEPKEEKERAEVVQVCPIDADEILVVESEQAVPDQAAEGGGNMATETEQYSPTSPVPEQQNTTTANVATEHNATFDTMHEQNTTFDIETSSQNTTNDSTSEQNSSEDAAPGQNVATATSITNLATEQNVITDEAPGVKDTSNDSDPVQGIAATTTSDSTPDETNQDTSGEQVDQELSSRDTSGGQESIIEISGEHDSSYDEDAAETRQGLSNEDDDDEDEDEDDEDRSVNSEEYEYLDGNELEEGECIDGGQDDEEDEDEEEDAAIETETINNQTIELTTEDDEEADGDGEVQEEEQQQ